MIGRPSILIVRLLGVRRLVGALVPKRCQGTALQVGALPFEHMARGWQTGAWPRSSHKGVRKMTFTITGEEYIFTLTVDTEGNLSSFTAVKGDITYDCSIQLSAHSVEQKVCCTQWGCTAGGC